MPRVTRLLLIPFLWLLLGLPVQAQTPTEQKWANIASWVTVGVAVGLDAKASWDSPNRSKAFILQGVRIGVTEGSTQLLKHFFPVDRPCSPSCGESHTNDSFPSGHTALAFQTIGGPRLAFAFSLGVATGAGRVISKRHRVVDVLAGAGIGWATSFIR